MKNITRTINRGKNKEKEIINQIISKKAWKNIILNINEGEKEVYFHGYKL